jgi:hypothetical protein
MPERLPIRREALGSDTRLQIVTVAETLIANVLNVMVIAMALGLLRHFEREPGGGGRSLPGESVAAVGFQFVALVRASLLRRPRCSTDAFHKFSRLLLITIVTGLAVPLARVSGTTPGGRVVRSEERRNWAGRSNFGRAGAFIG